MVKYVKGLVLLGLISLTTGFGACAQYEGESDLDSGEDVTSSEDPLTETRTMLFEGSCHWLACCAKGNCGLSNSAVTGACGKGCTDTKPWIARPKSNTAGYPCGSCVKVCVSGTTKCATAAVWDTSVTTSAIEGNVALFNALGLSHTENASSCSGTGQATVTITTASSTSCSL